MRPLAKSMLGLGMAVAGLAASFALAPLGVGMATAGTIVAVPMFGVNAPRARAIFYVALLCFSAALYRGSGSALLAAVPFLIGIGLPPNELLMKRGAAPTLFAPAVAFVVGLVLFSMAWPVGWWGIAVFPLGAMAFAMAIKCVSMWRSHGAYSARPKTLKVGQQMPALRLPKRDGSGTFNLADEKGRFTLLCFLRGDWCPMCHVLMRLFRREAPRLARHNVQLVSINPDGGPDAQEFARDLGLDYTILVDAHARVATEWGMIDSAPSTGDPVPVPICLLVDPDGVLRFVSRPDDFSTFADESRVLMLVEGHAQKAA